MYLKKALILESGAIKDLEYDFKFNDDGTPKPTVIVGRNGSGKSNLLSFITDALIEIAAKKFDDVVQYTDSGARKFYRISSGVTTRYGGSYELALLNFAEGEDNYTYVNKAGKLQKNTIAHRLQDFPEVPDWSSEENYKEVPEASDKKSIEQIFRNGCYVSFPYDRSERPYWFVASTTSDSAIFKDNFSHLLDKSILVQTSMNDIKPWLVDVICDYHESDKKDKMYDNVNQLLSAIMQMPQAFLLRLGRHFENRKLIVAYGVSNISLIAFDALSSGQATLMGIFCTILRYTNSDTRALTQDMQGIVLVDEIDAHLHADLLHDVLPRLMYLFPKIQFIVTAHSPLFPLGMEKQFGSDGFSLVELPDGHEITAERFSEFQSSFVYLRATREFEEHINNLVAAQQRPLIFFEGKTDIKYFETAAELLPGFDYLRDKVDFKCIGVVEKGRTKGGGADNLRKAYKVLQQNPIMLKAHTIFVFDCDRKNKDKNLDQGLLHVRVLDKNEINCRETGVENLLPPELFEERFYNQEKERPRGLDIVSEKKFKKVEFCDYLCDEKRDPNDFEGFRATLEMLENIVRSPTQPAETPATGHETKQQE